MRARMNEDRIARAKSAAMDITKLLGSEEFRGWEHVVAIDSPARFSGEALAESKRWLEGVGASILEIKQPEDMEAAIELRLVA